MKAIKTRSIYITGPDGTYFVLHGLQEFRTDKEFSQFAGLLKLAYKHRFKCSVDQIYVETSEQYYQRARMEGRTADDLARGLCPSQ